MDWVTVAGFLLTGGIGKALVDQFIGGIRHRRRARGRQESRLDALTRSRLWWIEHAYVARRLVVEHGGQLPPMDEENDPYTLWRATEDRNEQ